MPNLIFHCPRCGKTIATESQMQGRITKCPYCAKKTGERETMLDSSAEVGRRCWGALALVGGSVVVFFMFALSRHSSRCRIDYGGTEETLPSCEKTVPDVNEGNMKNDVGEDDVLCVDNPLQKFRLGSRPVSRLNSERCYVYHLVGCLGLQLMTLSYSKMNRLMAISLSAQGESGLSKERSDLRVSSLMRKCDFCYSGIQWRVMRNYMGWKFAEGRTLPSSDSDLFVSIIVNGDGVQMLLIDNAIKRTDDGSDIEADALKLQYDIQRYVRDHCPR